MKGVLQGRHRKGKAWGKGGSKEEGGYQRETEGITRRGERQRVPTGKEELPEGSTKKDETRGEHEGG